ncbi:MAG: inner membrane protein YpjD, partial [Telluria sp.]
MQTTFFIAAAILYAVCALLPSPRGAVISGVTALAWVLHGGALWPDMLANGTLRVGFAFMLSAA